MSYTSVPTGGTGTSVRFSYTMTSASPYSLNLDLKGDKKVDEKTVFQVIMIDRTNDKILLNDAGIIAKNHETAKMKAILKLKPEDQERLDDLHIESITLTNYEPIE